MKGANDLEQSLRMLVNIHENSEYLISPKRKSQMKLLDNKGEENDDDERTDERYEQKQLVLPRFSFGKPSKYYHDIQDMARSDIKMRLATLTYPSEHLDHGKQTTAKSKASSHRRSASYSYDTKYMSFEEHNNLSSIKQKEQNRRIPNVIAKLMGLGELPEYEASKESVSEKFGSERKAKELVSSKNKSPFPDTKAVRQGKKESGAAARQSLKNKAAQNGNVLAGPDFDAMQAILNQAPRGAVTDVLMHDQLAWKYLRGVSMNQQDTWEEDSEHSNTAYNRKNMESDLASKGMTSREESQIMTPKMHDMHTRQKSTAGFQEGKECKPRTSQKGNEKAKKSAARNQDRPQKDHSLKQSALSNRESKPSQVKQLAKEQQGNQRLKARDTKGNMSTLPYFSQHIEKPINPKKKLMHANQAPGSKRNFPDMSDVKQRKVHPEINKLEDLTDNGSDHSHLKQEPKTAQFSRPSDKEKSSSQHVTLEPQEVSVHKQETPQKLIKENRRISVLALPKNNQIADPKDGKGQGWKRLCDSDTANSKGTNISNHPKASTIRTENYGGRIKESKVTQALKETKGEPLSLTPELKMGQTLTSTVETNKVVSSRAAE